MDWTNGLKAPDGRRVVTRLPPPGVLLAAALAILLATLPFLTLQDPALREDLSDLLVPLYSLAAAILLFWGGKKSLAYSRQMGMAWMVLGLAALFNTAGEVTWSIMRTILHQEPFPSVADVFYLLTYPLFLAGILLMPARRGTPSERLIKFLEICVIFTAASLFLWVYLVAPIIPQNSDQDFGALVISLAYPLFDLLLLLALISLSYRKIIHNHLRPLVFLGIGLIWMIFADLLFSYQDLLDSYQGGGLADIGWLLSFVFLGLAGTCQALSQPIVAHSDQTTASPIQFPQPSWVETWMRTILPPTMLLAAYILLIYSHQHRLAISFEIMAIWVAVLMILTILVLIFYSLEHFQLNQDLRKFNQTLESRVAERTRDLSATADALRQSELKFRNVIEQALDGVALTDERGTVIEWNRQMEQITGLQATEVLGRVIWDVLFSLNPDEHRQPVLREQLQAMIEAALASGEANWLGHVTETKIAHLDGTHAHLQTVMFPIKTNRGFMMGSVSRDVTDIKRAEGVQKLNEIRLNSLLTLSQRAPGLDEEEIIQSALEEAIRLTRSAIGYCHFMNEDQETIELVTWSQDTLKECTAAPEKHYPLSQAGVWADCVRIQKPVIHNDYQHLDGRRGLPEGHSVLKRHMSVPVVESGKVYVIMGVGNKAEDYEDSDVRQLQLLANDTWQIVRRKRAEELLRQSEERFRTIVANIPGVVYRCKVDLPWQMLYISSEIENLSGYPASDFLEGKRYYADIVVPEDLGSEMIFGGISAHSPYAMEYRIRRADGEIRWVFEKGSPSLTPSGEVQWLDGVIIDITERKAMEHKLEKMASTDALTGLFNRRRFFEQLEIELQRVKRYSEPLSIMIYDVDGFKRINDTYGHDAGDLALQTMAAKLRQLLRQADIIGRLGGEEFGLLLPNTTLNAAVILAERVRQSIEQMSMEAGNGQFSITVSIGVTACDNGDFDIDRLIKQADIALYQAKGAGRNCVRKYERTGSTSKSPLGVL